MSDDRTFVRTAVTPDLYAALAKEAKRRKMTRSQAIRQALSEWIGKPDLATMPEPGRPKTKAE